jgi:regulator of sirC expression with transglutaminase-like and TPR domain
MPEPTAESEAERFLRGLGRSDAAVWPIAEAALALAALARPRASLARHRRELKRLADDVGQHPGSLGDLAAHARALNEVVLLRHGYRGDRADYDDLDNADLISVIDRKKGLPVALGILYMHAGRAQGWDMAGLAFPGHFLVRLAGAGEQLILDPFHDGRACGAAELRDLLRALAGPASELQPAHYASVPDREVLLRLQNNLKSRLLQERQHERAVRVLETMLMLAPDAFELSLQAGMLYRGLGNLRAAAAALERAIVLAPDGAARHQAAAMLQEWRRQLN